MGLTGSNRKPTERISKSKPDPEVAVTSSEKSSTKRSPAPQSLQNKPVAKESKERSSSTSKQLPATKPSQKIPSNQSSTAKPNILNKETPANTSSYNKDEKLPVSTISKRQTIVPATESKKSSGKLPVSDPKKPSSRMQIEKPTSTTASTRRSSSMETTISKPNIGSASSRKASALKESTKGEEALEPVKSSTKRARASGSSQKSSRASGRSSSRGGGGYSSKNVNTIYYILGVVLVLLIALIAKTALSGGNNKQKVIRNLNQLDQGMELCNKGSRIYNQDNEKAPEALLLVEDGYNKMTTELNKYRDNNGDLPVNLRGYEQKLADWGGFRKTLREQAYIVNQRSSRKSGN